MPHCVGGGVVSILKPRENRRVPRMASDGKSKYPLLKFLFRSMCDGIAVGWSLLLLVIWTDIGGIGTMIHASPMGELATAMLAAVFAITFGSVGMGIAVFTQPDDDSAAEG